MGYIVTACLTGGQQHGQLGHAERKGGGGVTPSQGTGEVDI